MSTLAEDKSATFGWILTVLVGAAIAEYFELNMVAVALPTFYKIFGSPAEVGWVLTAFALVGTASAAVGGRIGDVIGYRPVLIFALVTAGVGSLVSATANELWQVVLGRAIQGTSGVVFPLAIGALRASVAQPRKQQVGTAVIAGMPVAAGVLAVWTAGHVIGPWGWRSLFWISGGLSLVMAALALTLPRTRVRNGSLRDIDYLGGALLALGIALFLAGVTQITPWGFFAPGTVGLLSGGLVVLLGWFLYERDCREPIVDFKLFRNPGFAVSCIAMALYGAGINTGAAWGAAFALDPQSTGAGFGLSPGYYGNLAIVIGLGIGLPASLLAGRLTLRIGSVRTAAAGGLFGGAVYLVLAVGGLLVIGTQHFALFLIWALLNTAALVILAASLAVVVVNCVPAGETGSAVGFQQVIKQASQSIGYQLVSVILTTQLVAARAGGPAVLPGRRSIVLVLVYAGVLSVVIAPLAWLASRRAQREPSAPVIAEQALAGPVTAG
jgi:MFS family permease